MAKGLGIMAKALLKLADMVDAEIKQIETDKGVLYLIDADVPAKEVAVYALDAEGAQVMPEDGEYVYEDYKLVIENGVIVDMVDVNAAPPADGEGLSEKKIMKLADEAEITDIVDVVNTIIDVVNDLVDEVDGLGGDTEELKIVEELSAVKTKLNAVEGVASKTVLALEEIGKRSNGNFVKPNPDEEAGKGKKVSTADYFAQFDKKK